MAKASEELIRDAGRGKGKAVLRLFDEHNLPVFRYAWRLTGSVADAEDMVQECFLALLKPNCGFDPARSAVRTYLFGAVRNQWLKRLSRREDGLLRERADNATPEQQVLSGELATAVVRAIAELPDTQREVILLAHYEHLSLAEISEIMQLEIGAVKSRLQRARATLKECLAAYAPEPERVLDERQRP
jgi:RNA polymerase sigma-70 factor (ECF subfamily)